MQLAYVCAPLAGDIEANIKKAREYCTLLVDYGVCPISMHLAFNGVFDDNDPAQREKALEMCEKVVEYCDFLVVFGSVYSEGMKREIEAARSFCVPIFHWDTELKK